MQHLKHVLLYCICLCCSIGKTSVLKNKHNIIPKKVKKFNKRKHGKEGWMTNELITKVVKKNKLYIVWKTTPLTNENYEIYKARFKDHDKEVKKDIVNAKKR